MEKKTIGKVLDGVLKFLPTPNLMPKSKHELFKYITDLVPPVPEKVHYYCRECLLYLGETKVKCTLCKADSKRFFQLPLAQKIKILFEHHNLADIKD